MYPTVIMMLALDNRDATVVDAFLSLAGRLGVQRLVVAHVLPHDPIPEVLRGSLPSPQRHVPPELQRYIDSLRAALPDVQVECHTALGSALTELETLQSELSPDLLVIGRAMFIGGKSAWGPSGQNLVRHARCAALVVPRGWKAPAEGAVVGVDFSSEAVGALATATRLFEDVACLYQYDLRLSASGAITEQQFTEQLERNARSHFEQDVRPHVGGSADLQLEMVPSTRASDALMDRAGTDRVIVMGSRGLSPLAAMLLGSTAERVAGRANVPVLISRKKGKVMGVIEGLAHR